MESNARRENRRMKEVDPYKFLSLAIHAEDTIIFKIDRIDKSYNSDFEIIYEIYNTNVNIGSEVAKVLRTATTFSFIELEHKKILTNASAVEITYALSNYLFQNPHMLYYDIDIE